MKPWARSGLKLLDRRVEHADRWPTFNPACNSLGLSFCVGGLSGRPDRREDLQSGSFWKNIRYGSFFQSWERITILSARALRFCRRPWLPKARRYGPLSLFRQISAANRLVVVQHPSSPTRSPRCAAAATQFRGREAEACFQLSLQNSLPSFHSSCSREPVKLRAGPCP